MPELRHGEWTRRGGAAVLGDAATETMLGGLAEQTREAAQAQGYAVGWAEGRRAAAAEALAVRDQVAAARAAEDDVRRQEHDAAVTALAQAAEQVRGLLGDLTATIEAQASELAWALTEELVGREVRSADTVDTVRRVLAVLPDGPVATVSLHPSVVGDTVAQDLVARGVRVVADASLDRADALVEADGAVADLRIADALARLREVLR
ncbi:MAG TPA: FliH/SctL family protein [Nocardioides sp.]|nr:FliH/SctL family protein [Nocardioides sp.]